MPVLDTLLHQLGLEGFHGSAEGQYHGFAGNLYGEVRPYLVILFNAFPAIVIHKLTKSVLLVGEK